MLLTQRRRLARGAAPRPISACRCLAKPRSLVLINYSPIDYIFTRLFIAFLRHRKYPWMYFTRRTPVHPNDSSYFLPSLLFFAIFNSSGSFAGFLWPLVYPIAALALILELGFERFCARRFRFTYLLLDISKYGIFTVENNVRAEGLRLTLVDLYSDDKQNGCETDAK